MPGKINSVGCGRSSYVSSGDYVVTNSRILVAEAQCPGLSAVLPKKSGAKYIAEGMSAAVAAVAAVVDALLLV